jgi:PAS domain S-box-containing protein
MGGQSRVITYVRDITKRKQAEQALQQAQADLEQRVLTRTAQLQVTVEKLKREVEDRQRAEQALAESQRFLQLVLDCLPTPVFYKDKEGFFLGCNQAYEKFIGFPRRAIIGHTTADLVPADLAAESNAADQILFQELEEQVYESSVVGTDGQRHQVVFNKAPFFNPDGSLGGLVGSVFDITERKRMEAYMMRTERLAAMGSIAATLAHEIKNPLQTIQSNVELVLDFDLDPEEHDEYLRLCYNEIERLIEITSRLLNLALPRREVQQPGTIPAQIQHVLSLVTRALEKAQVQVTTEISPDLGTEVMPEQVIEVLLNLIINAIEALPNGGEIYITAWPEGRQTHIAVKNSGSHIAEEYLDRIFEPFFTTQPLGSGLGLPISYHIIEQLGGNLLAENLPDGVQFIISLPWKAPQLPSSDPDAPDID